MPAAIDLLLSLEINFDKGTVIAIGGSIIGIVVILFILVVLSGYLSSILGPFTSSIMVAVLVAATVVIMSWILHSKFISRI